MGGRLTATTGADGAARFVDLPPGLWTVSAYSGTPPGALTADSGAVAVEAGRAVTCTLRAVPALTAGLSIAALGPDGLPLVMSAGNVGSVNPAGSEGGGGGAALNSGTDGLLHATLTQPGLWQVTVRTHDFPTPQPNWYSDTTEPYLEADGLVAVSADLPPPAPLRLQTVRYERATLRVRLEDAAGKPARGTVIVGTPGTDLDYAASTDGHGEADFPEMTANQFGTPYTVSGYLAGQAAPLMLETGDPSPPDSALTGQTRIEPQQVTVGSDTTPLVVLRPQPVGYIRLHLALTPPETVNGFNVSDTSRPNGWRDVSEQVNDKTGDILYGPTPVGRDTVYLSYYRPGGTGHLPDTASLVVRQDAVVTLDLTPRPPGPATSTDPAEADPVIGTVLLHDGTTPAWNAHAVLCLPEPGLPNPQLTPQQPADARGRLLGMTTYFAGIPFYQTLALHGRVLPPTPPTGSAPAGPTVLAWMPGLTGAAFVPYVDGQPVRLVLPPALSVAGTVTVAGRPAAAVGGTFRVRAAYQGLGALNALLTLDVVAQPDGTFTLPGLTPGTYRVQAARDGIWLSATQTLTVGDTDPPLLVLDIPAPGVPVVLRLADARGRALPGRVVALDQPTPLEPVNHADAPPPPPPSRLHTHKTSAHTSAAASLLAARWSAPPPPRFAARARALLTAAAACTVRSDCSRAHSLAEFGRRLRPSSLAALS